MKRKRISRLEEINIDALLSLKAKAARKVVFKMLKNEMIDYKVYKKLMEAIRTNEASKLRNSEAPSH